MKARFRVAYLGLLLLLAFGVACNQTKTKPDAQVASDIQNRFNQDSGLQGKQLNIQSANGVVTLDGTVDNAAQRDTAARLAAGEEGVKTVVNNLQIGDQHPTQDQTASAVPARTPAESQPARHKKKSHRQVTEQQVADMTPEPALASAPVLNNTPPPPPPPPPAPKKVTIPSGTTLAVRLVDAIDSERNQAGQTFHATLDSPLAVEG